MSNTVQLNWLLCTRIFLLITYWNRSMHRNAIEKDSENIIIKIGWFFRKIPKYIGYHAQSLLLENCALKKLYGLWYVIFQKHTISFHFTTVCGQPLMTLYMSKPFGALLVILSHIYLWNKSILHFVVLILHTCLFASVSCIH